MAWLAAPSSDVASAYVVTGDPGSGKSAILSRLVTLAEADYRAAIPAAALAEAPVDTIPPVGSIHAALHAAGKTPEELTRDLAGRLGIPSSAPQELVEELLDGGRDITIVVDALDEAASPQSLVRDLLRPLVLDAGMVRLLLSSRRSLLQLLPGVRVLDLDEPGYFDRHDLIEYAARLLLSEPSPYVGAVELARAIAEAVAARAERSFLIVQLVARALAKSPTVDTRAPEWRRDLPATVGAAMDRYLVSIGEEEPRIRDLLRPLAWAEGNGLSDDELWAAWATALGTNRYEAHHVRWLRNTAAGNLLQGSRVPRGTAWRLFHAALAEHLRGATPAVQAQHAITALLRTRVPPLRDSHDAGADPTRRDWRLADEYTRAHLASHAALSGQLNTLLDDPLFLSAASPSRLLHAFRVAPALARNDATTAYEQTAHLLSESDPEVNASYLELSARLSGADELADRVAALPLQRPWRAVWAHGSAARSRPGPMTDHTGPLRALATVRLPNSRVALVAGGDDGLLWRWSLPDGVALGPPLRGHTGEINRITTAVLPDGHVVAVSSGSDGTLRVWDLVIGELLYEPIRDQAGQSRAMATCVLPDGRLVAVTGGYDSTLRLWDLTLGEPVTRLRGHTDTIEAVAIAVLADGRTLLVSGSRDRTLRLWDLSRGTLLGPPLSGHESRVLAVTAAVMPDSRVIVVSGGYDATVRLWDAATASAIGQPLRGHPGYVRTVTAEMLPDGQVVAVSGGHDGSLRVWDLAEPRPIGGPIQAHAGTVEAAAITLLRDGRALVASASEDGTVRLWDLMERKPMGPPLGGRARWRWAVAAGRLPHGREVVISGSQDGSLQVWDLADGMPLGEPLRGHVGRVRALTTAVLPDGRAVAVSGGYDGTVRVWDLVDGVPLGEPLRGHVGWIRAVSTAVLPDGRAIVLSGGADSVLRAWDLLSGKPLESLRGHTGGILSVATAMVPGDRLVAVSGDQDGVVRVWDLVDGVPLGEPFRGHVGWVRAVTTAVLPDGRVIVLSGGADNAVLAWHLTSGEAFGEPLPGHTGWVRTLSAAALPDGEVMVLSGGADGVVQAWQLQSRRQVCRVLLGNAVYMIALIPPATAVAATAHGLLRLDLAVRDG